jgi:putative addiction module CopG family antidote
MPIDQIRNVSRTAELNAFIRCQVATGQYQNPSGVVRAGFCLLQRQEQRGRRKQTTSGAEPIDGQ